MTRVVARRRPADPRIAIALVRVSTDADRQENGDAAQRAAIEAWAASTGTTIAAWYAEEVSGGAPVERRPVLLEALAALELHRAGTFVFQRWDRLARDPRAAALIELEVERVGARLVSADGVGNGEDPTAKLLKAMLLAIAEFEKAMIRARIRAALAVKQSRGELTGAPRYGHRAVRDDEGPARVLEDAHEQAVLAEARSLRSRGASIRAISRILAARGMVSRSGRPFTAARVHAMVAAR